MKKEQLKETLCTLKSNSRLIFLDIETTALTPEYGTIIEIGAIKVEKGRVIEQFSQLINPGNGVKLSRKTKEVTGLTDADLVGKPYLNKVILDFYNFCEKDNCPVVGHNIAFDLKFLNKYGSYYGLTFGNKKIDTLPLSKHYYPGRKSYKLEELCHDLGVEDNNHHRALNDSIVDFEFFKVMLRTTSFLEDIKDSCIDDNIKIKEEKPKDRVYKIVEKNLWEKHKFHRLYITLKSDNEYIKAYYDFDKHCWGIKEQSNPDDKVNFLQIENELKNDIKGEFDSIENWRRA